MSSETGVGLAKFGDFAKVAKFSLRLRNFRNPSEYFRNSSENSRLVDLHSCLPLHQIFLTLPWFSHSFLGWLMAET